MTTEKVNWQKFYGETCPICKQPIMSKEWIREPFFCSAGFLKSKGYRVDRHSKFIFEEQNFKRCKFYPVHKACRMTLTPSWKFDS